MKQRLLYIDNLKGFLILLVVLGHCIQATDADFDHNIAARYIMAFHMPLFMLVSGFVSYKPQMTWQTVRKRFVQLIVPFVAWAVLGVCIHNNWAGLYHVLLHPNTGLWFLWALFFIILELKVCDSVADKMKVRLEYVAMAMGMVMYGIMIALKFKLFGFQFIAWYFPFYCLGYFGKKYLSVIEKPLHSLQWLMLALFLVMAWFWMRKEPPTFMPEDSSVIYNYAYKFATGMIASAALLPLSKCFANRRVLIITKWGVKTLGIYAIHQSVISIIIKITGVPFTDGWAYGIFVVLLLLVVAATSNAVYCLLGMNRYTALLFLGKRTK